MQNDKQPNQTGNWADGLEKSGQMMISGNKVKLAADGSASLGRPWTGDELAAFDRIEKMHEESIAALDRMQRTHAESVMEQLNRAQAFAGSPKARKLYRDAYEVIKAFLPNK